MSSFTDDLTCLLANQIREGRTVDFKQELPGGRDSDKKEFLADVSSFANTDGGEVLLGVGETDGVATSIVGIDTTNLDESIRRLDSVIASGIDPRLRHHIRVVKDSSGKAVIVIRIFKSWIGPHRVVFGGHDKFYARNSAGKYALDTTELRQAFLASASLPDRIRQFSRERADHIRMGETPIPLWGSARLALHLVPVDSFAGQNEVDLHAVYARPELIPPPGASGHSRRYNLDGVLVYSVSGSSAVSYLQLFRNGAIEAVDGRILSIERNESTKVIPTIAFENRIIQSVETYVRAQKVMGLSAPVYLYISLLGVKGRSMELSQQQAFDDFGDQRFPIDRDALFLPEVLINDLDAAIAPQLRAGIDMVWNACGFAGSLNFDANGFWKAPTR